MKKLWILALILAAASSARAAGRAERVVIVVCDGLRPDGVTETDTPALDRLARSGVFFQNHHAVYPSTTEVNGVALATGAWPGRNGILANREYRPALDPARRSEMESAETVRRGDQLTGGRYLRLPTLAEILRQHGQSTAIAGTKPIALLQDRNVPESALPSHVTLYAGHTVPASALERLLPGFPAFPAPGSPNAGQDDWTTRALIGPLWEHGVPRFSLLWLSEPDRSQHRAGPGSPLARQALRSDDRNIERLLQALDARGLRDQTDVLVVSDHGFSTVDRGVDVAAVLRHAGFPAAREFSPAPKPGDVLVVSSGGTTLLYVIGHDPVLVNRLAAFLEQQDFTGVVFAARPVPGAFTLDRARIDNPDAADLVVSMRWSDRTNAVGVAGLLTVDGAPPAWATGHHGSLSRFDLHATLIAAGPDFPAVPPGDSRAGQPTGNPDLAPTVLAILGVPAPEQLGGRVLTDRLPAGAVRHRVLAATRQFEKQTWRQYLKITELGGAVYLDEGNGSIQPR